MNQLSGEPIVDGKFCGTSCLGRTELNTSYPKLPFFFRPYLRWEGPGWGWFYRRLGIRGVDNTDPRWHHAPIRTTRGKWHGYRMKLDLSDDVQRRAFFLGRFYDLEILQLLDVLLKPGDTFIDVGANVGLITLHAAWRVGEHGCVVAIEPNPNCCDQLREMIRDNGITHAHVHQVGLADNPAELTLHLLGHGTIMSTLAVVPTNEQITRRITVRVVKGDDLLASQGTDHLVIKIDVEGYELHALKGLAHTIERFHPVIITEIEPGNLRRAGTGALELVGFLIEHGYQAYRVSTRRRKLQQRLHLQPLDLPNDLNTIGTGIDTVWVAEGERRFDPKPYTV